jgi:Mitochondrial carrier protein
MTKASSTRDDVMAGAFAGASARLITAPFDVLKIRFQLQFAQKVKYTSLRQAFTTVIKEEGVIGLWKGNVAATYLWISYAMVQFGVYGFLKKSLEAIPDPFISRNDPIKSIDIFGPNKGITQKGINNVILPEQTNAHSTGHS